MANLNYSIQSGLLNKNEKLLKCFLVKGPGYAKKPFGHRVAYSNRTNLNYNYLTINEQKSYQQKQIFFCFKVLKCYCLRCFYEDKQNFSTTNLLFNNTDFSVVFFVKSWIFLIFLLSLTPLQDKD